MKKRQVISFGTYVGNSGTTRAGYEGSIDTDKLKNIGATTDGFGVFAYYTGTGTYGQFQKAGTSTLYGSEGSMPALSAYNANFMYNQKVTWNTTTNLWEYKPLKYWPNEINDSDVDDQDNDANDNTAWGSKDGTLTNGGNVSFFAYAPYVYVTPSSGGPKNTDDLGASWGNYNTGATDGITAITTNAATGDPKITYKLATDGNVVDLLWGTLLGTNTNVNNAGNTGVTGSSLASYPQGASLYSEEVLAPYTTNANLTKQRTDGKVGFAFKHALAKVGGSNVTGASGSDVNGLMIVLDIDKDGKESGGTRESWNNGGTDSWSTIVTVNSITITNDLDGNTSISASGSKGDEQIVTGGVFNLATGKWTVDSKGDTKYVHSITKDATAVEGSQAALLTDAIKETSAPTSGSEADFFAKSNTHTGVTETPQNVYQTETNPLVFIPGTTPTLRFTIDYIVRTFDNNLSKKYSEVRQVISKKVTFNELKLNKQYNILIHLGLTGVKLTATVSDWSVAGDDNDNGVIDGTEELKVEDIYLPINVSSLLVTYSAGPTTKFASNAAASSNIFTINSAKYYDGDVEQAVAPSTLAITATDDSWLNISAPTVTTKNTNTTFATRSTTVSIAKAPYICEESVAITQYGRIPADDATLTLTTSSFASALDNTAHASETYSVTAATIDNYYETSNTGAATGTKQSVSVSLTGGTDIAFNKAIFVDSAGKPVTWITATEGGFSVAANGTGVARTATVAYIINGKVVKSDKTVTQNA